MNSETPARGRAPTDQDPAGPTETKGIPRKITIAPALNGYIVQVGCQTLVFSTHKELLTELDRYLVNPKQVETEYRTGSVHRELVDGPCPTPEPMGESCGQFFATQEVNALTPPTPRAPRR